MYYTRETFMVAWRSFRMFGRELARMQIKRFTRVEFINLRNPIKVKDDK